MGEQQNLNESNGHVISAFLWKIAEKLGTKGIQFIIQIYLARLLFPDDYGMVAILSVFITLSNVFIQSGFSTALIQKREASALDFSTAFYSSLGIAAGFYLLLFLAAPLIAGFYHMEPLSGLLRISAVVLFAGAVNSIQYAYVSRKLQFREYTIACVLASGISGIAGIALASRGYGVWSLVIQQVTANYLAVIFLCFFVKWRPALEFSLHSLRRIFSYGWKILCTSLINSLYASLYNLIIGKVYSSELLGLYNRGDQFPNLIISNVNDTVQSIVLPVLANLQDDRRQVREAMRKGLMLNVFLVVPMMMGLAVVGRTVIRLFLTEKWLPALPYMQVLCMLYMLYPIHTMNIQCMKALGRSDLFFKVEVIKKSLELAVLFLTLRHGIMAMLYGQLLVSCVSVAINTVPVAGLIQYRTFEQLRDISPTLFAGAVMAAVVCAAGLPFQADWLRLIVQVVFGVLSYAGVNRIIKNPAFLFCMQAVGRNGLWKKK